MFSAILGLAGIIMGFSIRYVISAQEQDRVYAKRERQAKQAYRDMVR